MRIVKAFTLVEILIYMGLMALLITVLTNIFLSVLETQLESASVSAVEIDGRYVLSRLIYDIHPAAGLVTPSAAGQTATSLQLVNTHSYSVSDGVLYIDGTSRLNSIDTQISNFSVTRIGNNVDNDTLQISFTLTSSTQSQNYQTTVSPRTN